MPQVEKNPGLERLNVELDVGPTDTKERRKAGLAGQYTAGAAILFLAIAVIAVIRGFAGIGWVAAGICVALVVVAAMLMFDSERNRTIHLQK